MLRALRTSTRVIIRAAKPKFKYEISFRSPSHRSYTNLLRNRPPQPLNISRKIDHYTKLNQVTFHTTRRLDIPPVLAMLIRPLVNVGAFLFGRIFKKWWARQTPAQKDAFKKWLISQRNMFLGILGVFFSGLGMYYVVHLETDPLTHRRRFIILNEKQQAALARLTYEMHLEAHNDKLVSTNDPAYVRIEKVTRNLLHANKDLPFVKDETWTLNVVNTDMKNAYVLPGGHIFLFLGTLNMVENDDQLAIILSHEMAHVLLKHPIEQVSNGVILDLLLAIPLAVLWSIFPDLVAFFAQAFAKSILAIFLSLPYSRALEKEADEVGLRLAAKACVDVREAIAFWTMMKFLAVKNSEPTEVPWLSTHPDNEERVTFLDAKLPEALELRTQSGCLNVPRIDPRQRFKQSVARTAEPRGFLLDKKTK